MCTVYGFAKGLTKVLLNDSNKVTERLFENYMALQGNVILYALTKIQKMKILSLKLILWITVKKKEY